MAWFLAYLVQPHLSGHFELLVFGPMGWSGFCFFKSNRGVRQGDPLSPSIFILAMNYLSHMINNNVMERKIVPYGTNNGYSNVHHLMYADDLLVFSNGAKKSFTELLCIIQDFCSMAGQQINQEKSRIFMSKRISDNRRHSMCRASGFKEGSFPTKYLEAPLFPGRSKIIYFKNYEEIITKRINSWSKSFLSLDGRITLIQSVLNSLTIHVLSTLPIPKTCITRMQRIISNFLWDYGNTSRKHWWGGRLCVCQKRKEV